MAKRVLSGFVVIGLTAAAMSVGGGVSAGAETKVSLTGVHPSWATAARRRGDVAGSDQLRVRVTLKLHDQAGAEALATAVSDPDSPSYGKFVDAVAFRARFSPTAADVAKVTSWLTSQGLRIGAIPDNRFTVEATGTAAKLSAAFGVGFAKFAVADHVVRSITADPTVPASLAGIVDGISGLTATGAFAHPNTEGGDPAPAVSPSADPSPGFRNAGPCSSYFGEKPATELPRLLGFAPLSWAPCGYKPAQIRSAYGLDVPVAFGVDGRGTTVGIIDAFASPTIYADAAQYARRNDPAHPLKANQYSEIVPPGVFDASADDPCDPQGWYGEQTLDVEAVHATAPGAKIVYAGAESCNDDDINAVLLDLVDHQRAQIISNSYGNLGEVFVPRAEIRAFDQITLQAAAEGIGLYFSSGDDGDESANPDYVDENGAPGPLPAADFSATSPWVTAVGGTSIAIDRKGHTAVEQGWSTGISVLDTATNAWDTPDASDFLYGAGGGPSRIYAQPWYQRGTVPRRTSTALGTAPARVVPDVAMVGDPNTGFLVGQTQTFAEGVSYDEYRIGGTSLSSPLFAGVMALVDQVRGRPTGFANPVLYRSINRTLGVRDVTSGAKLAVARRNFVNGENAADGFTDPTARTFNSGLQTLVTGPGYDTLTGIGVPNGALSLLLWSRR